MPLECGVFDDAEAGLAEEASKADFTNHETAVQYNVPGSLVNPGRFLLEMRKFETKKDLNG